ncbi:hypothetical protein LTR10_017643 [Elasticomyces elasticus]|uniref:Uncharacterized protein n=1 Tax=Exophiala sideris TaxID=1016849 RepID=A0ABR0JQ35_9EURO|nr:hypothetical protein LTR10_017643 [Elasticomyces elasticus]KAK5038288.1 hypothetical protein LTS07_001758 [Exophiala sideris]KAK5044272.1 hypothetical protein LTR13_000628 [Exophiala sideris]KAK5067772.1 hypothetical protein LTR69_001761 [Exophiala sideris]KAK5183988.1 hypothetical protein LTR44_003493 [Eurotiomycetes sp. CCFEE 6388]
MSGPSVVEYARFHSLAIDHTAEDVLSYLTQLTTDFDPQKNVPSLPDPDFSAFKHDLQEPKIQLSQEASVLLAESIKDARPVIKWDNLLPKRHRIRDLKLEEPLLTTDHDTDVRIFKRSALRARDIDVLLAQFASDQCPTEDAFRDEWEDIVSGRSLKTVEEQLRKEKVHTTREALLRLSEAFRDESSGKEREEAMANDLSYFKTPLSPLSALEESSPVLSPSTTSEFQAGICSQEEDELDDLLLHAEREIKENDSKLTGSGSNVNFHTVNTSEAAAPQIPTKGVGHDVEKMPVPNLSEVRVSVPPEVSRSDLLASLFNDVVPSSQFSSLSNNEGRLAWSPFSPSLLDTNINERIEDTGLAEQAVRPPKGVIRSEQLLWKQPGLRLLNMNDESDEEMEEDEDLARAMSSPPQSDIPQKRIASEGDLKPRSSASVSPAREKMDIDDVAGNTRPSTASTRSLLPPGALRISLKPSTWQQNPETKDDVPGQHSHTTNSTFSASASIATFLDLRGKKFKRTQPHQKPCKEEISSDPIQTTQTETLDIQPLQGVKAGNSSQASEAVQVPATPCNKPLQLAQDTTPSMKALNGPRYVVLDTTLLQAQRALISHIEHHGKGLLAMIFRDLTAGNTSMPGVTSCAPDIILNPRTALFFTHFQALNQKNLPGQSNCTGQGMVQSKIIKLMQVYDRLFVLITMPLAGDQLLSTTQDTIASFTGFCSGHAMQKTCIVSPIWIPPDPPSLRMPGNIVRWTWDLICHHAFPVIDPGHGESSSLESITLIHDETLWELFLRQVGLNPVAAQVVLAMLKRPDAHDFQTEKGWGLRRLVQMEPKGRLDMFAETLGSRTIERLSTVLDMIDT